MLRISVAVLYAAHLVYFPIAFPKFYESARGVYSALIVATLIFIPYAIIFFSKDQDKTATAAKILLFIPVSLFFIYLLHVNLTGRAGGPQNALTYFVVIPGESMSYALISLLVWLLSGRGKKKPGGIP